MNNTRRPRDIFMHALILLALLAAVPGLLFAQAGSVEIPENARAKTYGDVWECDRGYREVEKACVAIEVPANAYPTSTSYGSGWECVWGYREVDETCVAIDVPPHAYLDASGDRWKCSRGYQMADGACVVVKVPPNGYLAESSYGPGGECDRG